MISSTAQGQSFTTAAEVKPILTATKPNWIAVRPYEGHDLVCCTNALAWRCAWTKIRYAPNGDGPETISPMEPCYECEASPNALKMDGCILPFVTFPAESLISVAVVLVFDDGAKESAQYERAAVLIP